MRILHIINNLDVGGAQSLLIDLVPAQKKLGNEVDILQLTSSKCHVLEDKAKTAGINLIIGSDKYSIYNPLYIFKVIPYLRKYDVVNVHLDPASYWVAAAKVISFCTTPLLYTVHSTGGHRIFDSFMQIVEKFVYKIAYSQIIACSKPALVRFRERFPSQRATYISNGIDLTKYYNAKKYTKKELAGIEEDKIVITMVSRFAFMKRHDTIVDAIKKLPERYHAVFVGGDGGNLSNIQQKVEKLNLNNRIHFLGQRADIPAILKSSDVIVMASNFEGLSLSSIEGMAVGKPFIASDVDGLREVVNGYGILYANGDSKELAQAILKICENPSFFEYISKRCYEKSTEYDINKVAKIYLDEYGMLI